MNNFIKRGAWLAAVSMTYLVLTTSTQAASFDCAVATPQEQLICFDYRLSDLDSQLAWTYAEALKRTKDKVALKQSQKDWVAAREKCTEVNCIMHAYVERIEALSPGAKLEGVYFPKGNIPWDFSPKPGYGVSSFAQLREKKLTFETLANNAPFSHGEDLIVPADDSSLAVVNSENEALNRLQRLPLVDNKFVLSGKDSELIKFGGAHLARMGMSYGECEGGIGMSGIYVGRNVPWTKTNILVQMRPGDWVPYRHQGTWVDPSCDEPDNVLKIDPNMMDAVVFNNSLFLQESHRSHDYVLRLDHNLQTASTLLGKKIYLGWGGDLEALTGKACDKFTKHDDLLGGIYYSTKHRVCIDKQLRKLIGEVGRFYN